MSIETNDPQYTDVEQLGQLSQWRKDWDNLRNYRDALYQTMRQNGMGEEIALFFTDHYVEAATKFMEDDPVHGREYMKRTMEIINPNDKPGGPSNSGPLS